MKVSHVHTFRMGSVTSKRARDKKEDEIRKFTHFDQQHFKLLHNGRLCETISKNCEWVVITSNIPLTKSNSSFAIYYKSAKHPMLSVTIINIISLLIWNAF